MSEKTQNILRWGLAGLVTLLFVFSAVNKIIGGKEAVEMAAKIGIDATSFRVLGFVELVAALLFLYPRTAMLGTLLLVAYMGGAIATHLEHGESYIPQIIISAFVWLVAVYRLPELRTRIGGN